MCRSWDGWIGDQAEKLATEKELTAGKRLFGTYSSALEAMTGQLQPTGTDYIIHALGDRQRLAYLQTFQQGEFLTIVVTPSPKVAPPERWSRNANWWFYRELYRYWQPVANTFQSGGMHLFWERTGTDNNLNVETTAAASAIQYQGKGVELTIQDSSSGKTGLISAARAVVGGASSYQVATVTDPTEINITAGTLKTSGSSYSVVDYSQRYVNVTITGGTFEGTTSAVFKGSNTSALEIDDCTVTTSGQIFNPASGKVTINGGSYTTSGSCVADAFTQGFINGGKFYCSNTDISSVFYTYEGSLSFSEGKYLAYNSEEKCWQLYDIPEAEDSGSLLVTPVGGVETQYSSVTAAFKALEENGGTIKLESDSSLKNGSALNIPKDKEITLDLNGHRLSLQPYDDTIRMIQVDGTLIIQVVREKAANWRFSDTTNVGITLGMTGGILFEKRYAFRL